MNRNKLDTVKEWFDRHFKSYECDYPPASAIRDAFQAAAPDRLLTDDRNPSVILDGAMAIDKIIRYDSQNFDVTGVVAWTFCDSTESIKPIYEFCRSPEANLIRAMLGIEKHWFLCFDDVFDGTSHTGADYHIVKHLMDTFDEMWLSENSCLMLVEQLASKRYMAKLAA
jgi:hypothetical protein